VGGGDGARCMILDVVGILEFYRRWKLDITGVTLDIDCTASISTIFDLHFPNLEIVFV
jgi:hypothetical protein